MRRGSRIAVVAAGTVLFAGMGGGSVLTATGGGSSPGDGSPAASDGELSRAGGAALAVTGGGRVTGTEAGDEESFYEVEVTLPGHQQVDVQLDHSFTVVAGFPDREESPGD